jgi:hypothetical protein
MRTRWPGDAAFGAETRYAGYQRKSKREGRNMATLALRRAAAVLLIAATVLGLGVTKALAQDYAGSTITTGGTTDGVGDVLVPASGVTISSGEVSNETGIGVVIDGGTSAGVTPGGGANASVGE